MRTQGTEEGGEGAKGRGWWRWGQRAEEQVGFGVEDSGLEGWLAVTISGPPAMTKMEAEWWDVRDRG